MAKAQTNSFQETAFRQALFSVLLDPALQLAAKWGLSLSEVSTLTEAAYFRAHRRDHTVQKCAEHMRISIRQAFRIKEQADRDLLASELELASLPRQTLLELATGDKHLGQLSRTLRESPEAIQACLNELTRRGYIAIARAHTAQPRYTLKSQLTRLVEPHGLRFLDGIRFALAPIVHTINARTDAGRRIRPLQQPEPTAIARVFSFPAIKASLAREVDLMLAEMLQRLKRLDAEASGSKGIAANETRAHLAIWVAEDTPAQS